MMHALIENNEITALRDAPAGGAWEDGQWLDFTDPTILSEWEKRHGWVPVVETPRPVATGSTLTARLVTTSGPLTDTWTITR